MTDICLSKPISAQRKTYRCAGREGNEGVLWLRAAWILVFSVFMGFIQVVGVVRGVVKRCSEGGWLRCMNTGLQRFDGCLQVVGVFEGVVAV